VATLVVLWMDVIITSSTGGGGEFGSGGGVFGSGGDGGRCVECVE